MITSSFTSYSANTPALTVTFSDEAKGELFCQQLQEVLGQLSLNTLLVVTKEDHFSSPLTTLSRGGRDSMIMMVNDCGEDLPLWLSRNHGLYDLILVGRKGGSEPGCAVIEEITPLDSPTFSENIGDDLAALSQKIVSWLDAQLRDVPVWGCLLIGGKSSRMGQPKHLIQDRQGRTWFERSLLLLGKYVDRTIIVGDGDIPATCSEVTRLPDVPQVQGPLAGVLAAMRWNPSVSWVVSACDMPWMSEDGLQWLLERRRAGVWGTVPMQQEGGRLEPLFALYDFRCRELFERVCSSNIFRMSAIASEDKIETPDLPPSLSVGWKNCNRPEDLTDEVSSNSS